MAKHAPTRRMRAVLGTWVEVGVVAHEDDAAAPATEATAAAGGHAHEDDACARDGDSARLRAIDAAFGALHDAHARWSFHEPASELSRINANPGHWVPCSRETTRLLRLGRALMRASDGAFDCTVGGLWVAQRRLPDHGGTPALPRGHGRDIDVRRDAVRLNRPVRLTLDGIAKGRAVDLAVEALRQCGTRAGWVNAGGDLRVFGDVALPLLQRDAAGGLHTLGWLRDGAAASSATTSITPPPAPAASDGAAARPKESMQQGTHSPPGIAGTTHTVIAPTAWRADALTKLAASTAPEHVDAVLARFGARLLRPDAP